jgi:glycosyltransferase involved in cell wall biosynthesis
MVLPSLFGEGLPMVVLEAMACGLPVVGTRVEGVPEAIGDGLSGLLAAPNDPADLARAISRIVSGELSWDDLSRRARARQVERFSDGSMAAGVAAVYREVLGMVDGGEVVDGGRWTVDGKEEESACCQAGS